MKTSTVQSIYRNRMKSQDIPVLPWAVMVILLTAAMVAWSPGKASPAKTGEIAWSGCSASLYWEYFLAHNPDGPQVAQPACLPDTGADSGASLYWEYFFAHDSASPQVIQLASLPDTGADDRPDSGASLYWEYFFAHNTGNPYNALIASLPVTGEDSHP